MSETGDIFLSIRGLIKLYDQHLEGIRTEYRLSHIEITIISFLHNHPGKDTATAISDVRMLPKGNVSQGVESLIQKSLLIRTPDASDRRKIHLSLTEEALPIVEEIEQEKNHFASKIFAGFSPEELNLYLEMNERIRCNAQRELKGDKKYVK
ncbi:MAG: MarR family transcriptional regulator [Eubacteriales bacterium]|nr:MarR family transcriptional regulator [Eubacteriales bacterium]